MRQTITDAGILGCFFCLRKDLKFSFMYGAALLSLCFVLNPLIGSMIHDLCLTLVTAH
jgi:hypothetical protein